MDDSGGGTQSEYTKYQASGMKSGAFFVLPNRVIG